MNRLATIVPLFMALVSSAASFFTAQSSNYSVSTAPISIAIADVNLDGWPDIVVAHQNDPNLWVLTNKADGTFASAPPIPAVACNRIIAQELNGDNLPDLLLLQNGGSTFVYTNAGGSFALASLNDLNFVDAEGFAMADLNGDGWVELLSVAGGPIQIFTNDHTGTFTHSVDTFANGFYPWAMVSADLDNNGSLDLLVSHWEDRPAILTNDGSGVLRWARFFNDFGGPYVPRVADMNHDGLIDCLFTGSLFTNNGNGTFTLARSTNSIGALADLDGDGWTEIITPALMVRTNNHFNVFTKLAQLRVPSTIQTIAVADVNKDGLPDLVVANGAGGETGFISILLQSAQVSLEIARGNPGSTNIALRWPATEPRMFLEAKSDLSSPGSWSMLSAITNAAGTHYQVNQPATAAKEFFRLRN